MKEVESKVYLVAETAINSYPQSDWLKNLGVKDKDKQQIENSFVNVSDPEVLIILAAKRCYKSFVPGLNPNVTKIRFDPKEFIYNILKSGHGSVLEHASVTFALEGISRVLTHELVRHRIGVAISQESLRYVALDDFNYILPPDVQEEEPLHNKFNKLFDILKIAQAELKAMFPNWNTMPFAEKKKWTSTFRRLAPMGLATGMVWTVNFRALRHILELRTHRSAEWEIRSLFNKIGEICIKKWPLIFQDFVKCNTGDGLYCFESEFSKV